MGDGGADYNPSQDDAAALATYREHRAPEPDPAAPTPEAAPTSSLPVPGDPVAEPELSPEDKRLERILTRVTRLDEEHKTLQKTVGERDAELAKAREEAKFAADYRKELAEFQENPEVFFKRVNWDPDKIRDYIVNGPRPVDATTSKLAREQADLKARLEKYEAAEAQRTQQSRVNDFKATLPKQLEADAAKYPLTLAFYETPAALSDALFGQMEQVYRQQNRELTAAEAATALEDVLSKHYERLNRAKSKPGTPSAGTAPPTKSPTPPTLTNVPPASARPPTPPDSESDDDLLAAAIQSLRAKNRAAA